MITVGLALASTPITRYEFQGLVKVVLDVARRRVCLSSIDVRRTMNTIIDEILRAINAPGRVDVRLVIGKQILVISRVEIKQTAHQIGLSSYSKKFRHHL